MKRKILVCLLCFGTLFSVFSFTISAAPVVDVTYEENFEYGDTDITASANCGSTEIVEEDGNHILHFVPNKTGYTLAPFGPYVADYDFSVRVRQDTRGGQKNLSKILIHSEWGEGNTYQINLYNYRITATYEKVQEKITLAEKTGLEFNDNQWYTLNIFSRGDTCTLYIDGKKIFSYTSDAREEGCFGFVTWQTDFYVDDISITEYPDGTAPAVESIMPPEVESDDRKVVESERPTRTMKDSMVKISEIVSGGMSGRTILSVILFAVAGIALVLLIVLIIAELRKKNKNKDSSA